MGCTERGGKNKVRNHLYSVLMGELKEGWRQVYSRDFS